MHLLAAALVDSFDHAIRAWGAARSWPLEQALRLCLAALCGALIGLEREMRGREAGFRTHLLVCVGSALVMLVSVNFTVRPWPHEPGFNINVDPARIAYGVMTGIGFIGAGTILKHGATVRGLTTAASLWCVAAVGLSAGFGMYTITAFATVMIFCALWFLAYLDDVIPQPRFRTLTIRRHWTPRVVEQTIERVKSAGLKVLTVSFDRSSNPVHVDISLHVSYRHRHKYYTLVQSIEQDTDYQLLASQED